MSQQATVKRKSLSGQRWQLEVDGDGFFTATTEAEGKKFFAYFGRHEPDAHTLATLTLADADEVWDGSTWE